MLTGKGIYVWRIKDCEDGNIANIVTMAKNANFSHVIIKIADGVQGYNYTTEDGDMAKELAQALQAVGIEPWGYQYIYGEDPVREAETANRRMKETGCVGFVINAEKEIRDIADNDVVVDRYFNALCVDFPWVLSSYRYPETHPKFPWHTFVTRIVGDEDFMMPQVYWMQAHDPAVQLRKCLAQYAKITDLPILPTGSAFCEHGWSPTCEDIEDFAYEAQEQGLPGINFWEWNRTRRDGFWKTVRDIEFSPEEHVSLIGENCCEELDKKLDKFIDDYGDNHYAIKNTNDRIDANATEIAENDKQIDNVRLYANSNEVEIEKLLIEDTANVITFQDIQDNIAGLTADLGILRVRELAHTREHNVDLERIQGELDLDDDMFLIHKGLLEELDKDFDYHLEHNATEFGAMEDKIEELEFEINKLKFKTIPECNHSHRKFFSWLWNRK